MNQAIYINQALIKSSPPVRACGSSPPQPTGSHVTRWGTDPSFLGSYSYWAVGSSPADNVSLSLPEGRVRFAGEATDQLYFGTVHGAMLSGMREAGLLLNTTVTVADLL